MKRATRLGAWLAVGAPASPRHRPTLSSDFSERYSAHMSSMADSVRGASAPPHILE